MKGSHSLKLYAENDNIQAKKTYQALGMSQNGEKFYTYDLILSKLSISDIK